MFVNYSPISQISGRSYVFIHAEIDSWFMLQMPSYN